MNNKNYTIKQLKNMFDFGVAEGRERQKGLGECKFEDYILQLPEHPLTDTDQNQERKEVDYESIIDRMCPKGDWTDEMVHAALEAAVTEYKRLNNITHE